MRSKIKKIVITVIILCAIGISAGRHWYNNRAIEFKDENMAKLMAEYCGKTYGEDMEITPNDMKEISHVNIGYAGYYDTLEDLKWCTGVEVLDIDIGVYRNTLFAYKIAQGEAPGEVTKEKVKQYEKELGKVLPKMKNLKELYIASNKGCMWESFDFLEDCD